MNERLFLSFHIHHPHSEAAMQDSIFMSLTEKFDEESRFYNLSKWINEIKESFTTARLLIVQSQFNRRDLTRISKRTLYVDSLDYARFDVYVGLLKSAHLLSYNTLDKIAGFINEYCQLGHKTNRLYFATTESFWCNGERIRDEFLDMGNISLYALYDIFRDFQSGHYTQLRNIRNALVHRKLIVHIFAPPDHRINDAEEILYDALVQQTAELLRLTKSAIIYLISFVNSEERKKHRDDGTVIPFTAFTM